MSKDNISEQYRRQVDELIDSDTGHYLSFPLSQKEQDIKWEEISTEMDIGEVWEDISSDLDRLMPLNSHSGVIVRSIAALLIIAIGIIPIKKEILNPDREQPDIILNHQQSENNTDQVLENKLTDSYTGEHVDGESPSYLISTPGKRENSTSKTPTIKNKTDPVKVTPVDINEEAFYKNSDKSEVVDTYQPSSLQEIHFDGPGNSTALITDQKGPKEIPPDIQVDTLKINTSTINTGLSIQPNHSGRISVGLIALFKNTWLLNHETFDGFNSESLNTTVFVFTPDVGLGFNYLLNNNWALQGDGFFYSNTGQEYLQYIYGHYSRKSIALKYSTIILSAKYKFTGEEGSAKRFTINIIAGSYLSVLHHADQNIETDYKNIGSQYSKFDYGVKLGSEIELRVFKHFTVAPGLFMSFGIPNIYKGDGYIPGYFRKTHNGVAAIQFAFYYSW